MTTAAARPILPVWPTVSQAFATIPVHWLSVVRIFWAWGAVMALLVVAWFLTFPVRKLPPIGTPPSPESFTPPSLGFILTAIALQVVGLLACCSTAVAWHRLILLGEQPRAIHLDIGRPVIRYLGRLLLIALAAFPILLLCALVVLPFFHDFAPPPNPLTPPSAGYMLVLSVINFAVGLPALMVFTRLCVSLPGIAIGQQMTLSETWQRTAGNTGRLLGGTLLISVPSYAIGLAWQVATWQTTWPSSIGPFLVTAVLAQVLVGFLVAVAAISFLSLSYRVLIGTAEPGRPHVG